LPEIDAYIKYFNNNSEFLAVDSTQLGSDYDIDEFDVIWEFKGLGGIKVQDKILIHEYSSLSTGSAPKLKNLLKSKLNKKPDLRIFLNESVKEGFKFHDSIDYCYRDMGIDESFVNTISEKKEYDFVYVGSIGRERGIDKFLQSFDTKSLGKLCLVGTVEDELYNQYKRNSDIIFTGKVPYQEVPKIASRAFYGINYIPDKYPYNIQTSTKLLEYLALGLKVITTDYKWVRNFEKKYNCSFFKIGEKNYKLKSEYLDKHQFSSNFNPEWFLWDRRIEQSGINEKILDILKKKKEMNDNERYNQKSSSVF